MHYLGMCALHSSINMAHAHLFVAASIVIGIAASGLSLWLAFVGATWRSTALSAAVMALAISAMHYTAMAGFEIVSLCEPSSVIEVPALSQGLLAIIVAVTAFVISGIFLLTLMPEGGLIAVAPVDLSASQGRMVLQVGEPTTNLKESPGNASFSILHRVLPVEKNGQRCTMLISRLFAVQPQAHYTLLFDGEATWFCPLSLSQVAKVLDSANFAQVHRSHIIDLDRFRLVRGTGNGGMFEAISKTPYKVPLSRARRAWIKQQLQVRFSPAQQYYAPSGSK
ncbi:putative transmembrane protein CoxH (plasmid) [Afipia carboxidovorans OM5]|uniref:Putative transmembrane protein CoxH n=1 Tax=Afipia carboxidovorans (strain ATCC 49405 / DSM 1227 / KCTC 32145 / OM5) TaxID=504832 RepID=F8C101_AFIC5|nr:MHYT domain-containing protein [Afipia carboxidovorans]AEI04483.1 putative transmembrane protein CoxH [Afipia carboxidovorans OM4]AEI08111.1 putative transmembrane protein CoxH [Afipia carboxidovorans OM5]